MLTPSLTRFVSPAVLDAEWNVVAAFVPALSELLAPDGGWEDV
jgi:hypothetical protein